VKLVSQYQYISTLDFIGGKDDGMMEAVVTIGTIRRAYCSNCHHRLHHQAQSNCHHQRTNTQPWPFAGWMPFLSPNQGRKF